MLYLIAVLGGAMVALPAVAASEGPPPSIEAAGGYYGEYAWKNGVVTVPAGGSVAISNPSASVSHGVLWEGPPATPACSGVPSEGSTKWSGSCTFSQPGTYRFYCAVHGKAMSGTITVTAPSTTPATTTPSTTTTAVTTPGATPTTAPALTSAGESPLAGDAVSAVEVAPAQRGAAVRGSLLVSQAGAGGRLEVRLQASRASLARAGRGTLMVVGRLLRSQLTPGPLSFRVALATRARRALRRNRRLALKVTLVLTPAHGTPLTLHRAVTLKP
jgi:plastocyanin